MKQFLIRTANLLLIAAILVGYQRGALARAAQVSAHQEELSAAQALAEEYEREVQEAQSQAQQNQSEQEEGLFQDGTWEGTAQGFGGDITVAVTVSQGKVTAIDVLHAEGEDPAYFSKAQSVIPAIVEAQGEAVDTVSGATFSSTGLINATANALEGART